MGKDVLREMLEKYLQDLCGKEKSEHTLQKYHRDISKFLSYIEPEGITRGNVLSFKCQLRQKYKDVSTNSILTAVNGFLDYCGRGECKVKLLKIQRDIFANPERELSKQEYMRIVHTAEKHRKEQLSLLIQTICSCGIRVSELRFLTKSCLCTRQMVVECKNKKRKVLLPSELCKKLSAYCKTQNIESGVIFRTKSGAPLDRSNIWKMMKSLCVGAGVAKSKVFPHNLRHLFARTYYKIQKDIARLADVLGHSNINTTRIYTMESGKTHERQINKLALLL